MSEPFQEVSVRAGPVSLPGLLGVPGDPVGVVVFAHGSGSSRHSPRNNAVAEELREAGLGTLLFDLLTEEEGQDRQKVFDIGLLAVRLEAAAGWLREQAGLERVPLGYFGASTGAAAALQAAARQDERVGAVVSRGGRVDLAGADLGNVTSPTLFIVGESDHTVLELNREAIELLGTEERSLEVVPGAGHLFEEPGALEAVTELARDWFIEHLG